MVKNLLNPARRWPIIKCLLLVLLLAAAPAQGLIFMWKDSAGIAHYSNKEYDVPARYKAKVKMLYPEASDAGRVQSGNAVAVNQAAKPEAGIVAPPAQVKSAPPVTPERRIRKQRERNRDDEE
ncbi:MAG: hypothetical protein A2076_17130 [Geobacteraceae bacterium GWC2_53_11]|nr:MAG: hypothetical protein A2076_17130 [Geobacteraceae bacterium GWC2_53_11]